MKTEEGVPDKEKQLKEVHKTEEVHKAISEFLGKINKCVCVPQRATPITILATVSEEASCFSLLGRTQ